MQLHLVYNQNKLLNKLATGYIDAIVYYMYTIHRHAVALFYYIHLAGITSLLDRRLIIPHAQGSDNRQAVNNVLRCRGPIETKPASLITLKRRR
jgi:hypothetical protein